MVKPLSAQLEAVPVYAGATILGDGSAALILDVLALAQRARVLAAGREPARGAADHAGDDRGTAPAALLVACAGQDRQVAIPLGQVTRLEELPWDLRVLATDLSEEMVGRTSAGRYSQLEINRGLPAAKLVRHFTRAGTDWEVSEPLRRMVEARQLNLAAPFPPLPPVDVAFLRADRR